MVEPIMYLAIGFLVSMLCGLMIVPLVHNRAVRLTTKRLEAATPLSMAEIQADKDQLRAEFAMSARRLEMSVEQLRNRTTSQLADLGKKSDAINRLKIELGDRNAAIFSLEAREKALKDQLRATEGEFAARTQSLQAAEQQLADKQAELARLSSDLSQSAMTADSRQVELVAARSQIEMLQNRASDAEKELAATQQRLTEQRGIAEMVARDLADTRGKVDELNARIGDLDRQFAAKTSETELLSARITDLETRLAEQGKILAERDYENNLLREQAETAKQTEQKLREEIASGAAFSAAVDKLRTEKSALEEQLSSVRDERAKLQSDLEAITQEVKGSWPTERKDNELLRERISDIAAEVAKLAMTLEGPDSPIKAILVSDEQQKPSISTIVKAAAANGAAAGGTGANGTAANGAAPGSGTAGNASAAPRGTLAERIRALQAHASRAGQPG